MARNEVFQKLASEISNAVFATGITAVDEVQKQALPSGLTIGDHMKEVIAKLGENISTVIGILQKKDQPSMLKRSASIRRLIEAKMGHKLVYGKEHVGLAQSVHRSWTSSRSESS